MGPSEPTLMLPTPAAARRRATLARTSRRCFCCSTKAASCAARAPCTRRLCAMSAAFCAITCDASRRPCSVLTRSDSSCSILLARSSAAMRAAPRSAASAASTSARAASAAAARSCRACSLRARVACAGAAGAAGRMGTPQRGRLPQVPGRVRAAAGCADSVCRSMRAPAPAACWSTWRRAPRSAPCAAAAPPACAPPRQGRRPACAERLFALRALPQTRPAAASPAPRPADPVDLGADALQLAGGDYCHSPRHGGSSRPAGATRGRGATGRGTYVGRSRLYRGFVQFYRAWQRLGLFCLPCWATLVTVQLCIPSAPAWGPRRGRATDHWRQHACRHVPSAVSSVIVPC